MNWLYLYIAILCEVIATSALKISDGFTQILPSIVTIIGYGAAFYLLSLTLKTIPVGVAYAVWSGLGILLMSVIGIVAFNQKPDFAGLAGIAFILIGVLIIQLFSKVVAH